MVDGVIVADVVSVPVRVACPSLPETLPLPVTVTDTVGKWVADCSNENDSVTERCRVVELVASAVCDDGLVSVAAGDGVGGGVMVCVSESVPAIVAVAFGAWDAVAGAVAVKVKGGVGVGGSVVVSVAVSVALLSAVSVGNCVAVGGGVTVIVSVEVSRFVRVAVSIVRVAFAVGECVSDKITVAVRV